MMCACLLWYELDRHRHAVEDSKSKAEQSRADTRLNDSSWRNKLAPSERHCLPLATLYKEIKRCSGCIYYISITDRTEQTRLQQSSEEDRVVKVDCAGRNNQEGGEGRRAEPDTAICLNILLE